MIARIRTAFVGLLALATLTAVVAGLPVVLLKYGGFPLPRHRISWHHVLAAVTSGDNGALALAVVKDCSWVGWLCFTACTAVELLAVARRRQSPWLHLGGVQNVAARLVTLAALTFAAPTAVSLTASVSPASAQVVAAGLARPQVTPPQDTPLLGTPPQVTLRSAISPAWDPAGPALAVDATTATRVVTVHAGECLWTIAQRYLGAGNRYPEIASLNYGREMGNGTVFTNPALIEPGWQLLVPDADNGSNHAPAGDASGTASGTGADGNGRPPGAGGSKSAGGGHHLGHATKDSRYRRRHPGAWHGAGQNASQGAAVAPAGVRVLTGAVADLANTRDVAASPSPHMAADLTGARRDQGGGDHLSQAAAFVAGALAGSILTSLNRLRRRQRQERRRGRRIALPVDQRVQATEQRLRAAAPDALTDPNDAGGFQGGVRSLQDALVLLEERIAGTAQALPDIIGLHVTPGVLEILLATPAIESPPAPFEMTPGRQGMCWQLAAPATLDQARLAGESRLSGLNRTNDGPSAARGGHLLPGLFTAGATADGYLLLDLEALQVTGCDGPPDLVDRVITSAATELATGQWSGWYELILVGCNELEVLGRADHCDTVEDALMYLEARSAVIGQRLAGLSSSDVRQLRIISPVDEDFGLTIVVSRIEPTPEELERLLALAEDGPGGIAVLTAGDAETSEGRMAPTVLQLAPDPLSSGGIVANVVPLQIGVWPQPLTAVDYDSITTLFGVASDLTDVAADSEPYAMYGAPPWIPQAAAMVAAEDVVGGLDLEPAELESDHDSPSGPSEADSLPPGRLAADPLEPGSSTVATLQPDAPPTRALPIADQPRAAPRHAAAQPLQIKILGPFVISGAAEQLQPKQAELVLALALAAPTGLSNSALCAMLGPDPDHPKPGDAVRQIITRTRRRLGHARDGQDYIIHTGNGHYTLHPDSSLDLTEFRDLVASRQPDNMRLATSMIRGQPFSGSYFWWIDIPLLESVRAELVDAAEIVAEFELANGYARAAARAARAGLMAEESAEQLWRVLMRAEHAAGNLAGVTEAWRHCLNAIEDITPGGEPHPDTEALYRQLTTSANKPASVRG